MAIKFTDAKRGMPSKPSQLDKLDDLVKVKERELAEAAAKIYTLEELIENSFEADWDSYKEDMLTIPAPWRFYISEEDWVLSRAKIPLAASSFARRKYYRTELPHTDWEMPQQEEIKQYLKDCAKYDKPWMYWMYEYNGEIKPCQKELSWKSSSRFFRIDVPNDQVVVDQVGKLVSRGDKLPGWEVGDLDQYIEDARKYGMPWLLWRYREPSGTLRKPQSDIRHLFNREGYTFYKSNKVIIVTAPPSKEKTEHALVVYFNSASDLEEFKSNF